MKLTDEKSTLRVLLGKKPVDRLTVTQFCRVAKVSRGWLYWHYPDIEGLYVEVLKREMTTSFVAPKRWSQEAQMLVTLEKLAAEQVLYANLLRLLGHRDDCYLALQEHWVLLVLEHQECETEQEYAQLRVLANYLFVYLIDWLKRGCVVATAEVYYHMRSLMTSFAGPN